MSQRSDLDAGPAAARRSAHRPPPQVDATVVALFVGAVAVLLAGVLALGSAFGGDDDGPADGPGPTQPASTAPANVPGAPEQNQQPDRDNGRDPFDSRWRR
jgi:hypothetical protein